MRCFIIESADGGATFSRPREITGAFAGFRSQSGYDWRVIATGPGHGVQLASGRLVVPVWLSTSDGGNAHRPSVSSTLFSDDAGATWQAGEIAAGRNDGVLNPSETLVVETTPGEVMLNIRNESAVHRRAVVRSATGSSGWSQPVYAPELLEPVCMASIIRRPDGGLVFANPATLEPNPARPEAVAKLRQNLGLRLSRDAGRTWSEPLVLEPGPSAYSDLAVAPDGTLLCFYEHGEKSPYESMSLARVPAAALP
jgi:sialidase-1